MSYSLQKISTKKWTRLILNEKVTNYVAIDSMNSNLTNKSHVTQFQ